MVWFIQTNTIEPISSVFRLLCVFAPISSQRPTSSDESNHFRKWLCFAFIHTMGRWHAWVHRIYIYVDVAENLLCKTPLPFVPHICLCAQLINVDCVLQNMHAFCMRHHFVLLHCVSRGAFTVTYPSTKRCWCSYHVENIICFQMFVVRYEIVWGFFFVLSSSHSNCTNKFVLNILRFGLRHKRNKYLFVHGRAGMLCMWRSILFSRPSFSQGVCVWNECGRFTLSRNYEYLFLLFWQIEQLFFHSVVVVASHVMITRNK